MRSFYVGSAIGMLLLTAACTTPVRAQRGEILSGVPAHPRESARYVIYLHGRIIEEKGTRPTHERFGVYEYQRILEALASNGAVVIAEQRAPGTDFQQFGAHLATQVRELLAGGVPPQNITVVGFSKGGAIAIDAAARLANPGLRFVFLGSCGPWLDELEDLDVGGRILSIYEESDEIGTSCQPLFERARLPGERRELMIRTGAAHGAFYRPRPEWVEPVLRWISGN